MATRISTLTQSPLVPLGTVERDTIPKIFFGAIDRVSRLDAMRYRDGGEWKTLSHSEVLDRVTALAAALAARGVTRGDRIALMSENRPEWAIVDFAVLGLGAADVPVYATLPPVQIAYILNDSGAKAIFVSTREQLDKILEIRAHVPSLEWVVAFDDTEGAPGVDRLDDVLEAGRREIREGRAAPFREQALEIERDDLATLIYTSGTTGHPKGVMLTHYNIASNVAGSLRHGIIDLEPGERTLSFLPLSHAFERTVDYAYWDAGASIAYVGDLTRVAEALVEVQPNIVAAAPRVFEKIYTRVMGATGIKRALVMWAKRVGEAGVDRRLAGTMGPRGVREKLADRLVFSKLRARTGGRIRAFVSGSAPLSADIARFFWAAGIPIYEGYGLTETSPVMTANQPGAARLGTVGHPIPGVEVRIGGQGEILNRGPNVMAGYWNNPDATTEIIDADGWLHTGDIGEIDADGFLRITDRIKNVIVTAGGKNIAPAPIENVAVLSPYVEQVVMLGDRRAFPSLLVVPDFANLDAWAKEQGIDSSDRNRLIEDPRVRQLLESETLGRLGNFARYETPKKIAIVADEFTIESGLLTPTMKVKRPAVEERFRQVIEEMYRET